MIIATIQFIIFLLSAVSNIATAYTEEAVYAIRIEYAAPRLP
jgi:hypothetical protein